MYTHENIYVKKKKTFRELKKKREGFQHNMHGFRN